MQALCFSQTRCPGGGCGGPGRRSAGTRGVTAGASVPLPLLVPTALPAPRSPSTPLVQRHCRGALKSAVNTHESGAGGKGFPLLQSLRDVLKHFSKEAVFLGGLWGCWLRDPIPLGGLGSGFSSSRWRQLWTGERAPAERVTLLRSGGMWLCTTAVYKNVLLKILENKGQFTDSAEIYIFFPFWQRPG